MNFNFNDCKNTRCYVQFKSGPHLVLIHTLSDFLSTSPEKVVLQFDPIDKYKQLYNLDIMNNPKRTIYSIDNLNIVFFISYAEINGDCFFLGIKIESPLVKYVDKNLLNQISLTVTKCLCDEAKDKFRNSIASFGEPLITQVISKCISMKYQRAKINHLLNLFKNLRSTTFEGKYFSTGFILTKSIYLYKKKNLDKGQFMILPNEYSYRLSDEQGRRFWFLADGIGTFFIADLKSNINAIYQYNGEGNYVNDSLLKSRLSGADLLLRVLNGRELSVIDSNGCEFLHQENVWKYRDYDALKKCFQDYIPLDDQLYYSIMKYVLRCSRDDKSSIIWIVKNENRILDSITNSEPNKVLKDSNERLNINTPSLEPLIDRLMASDGAIVINLKGEILYYGVFADLSQKPHVGVKGSGETAASILGQNGIAIKISQDGPITIFIEGLQNPIPF